MKNKCVFVLVVFMIISLLSQVGYAAEMPEEGFLISGVVSEETTAAENKIPPIATSVGGVDGSSLSDIASASEAESEASVTNGNPDEIFDFSVSEDYILDSMPSEAPTFLTPVEDNAALAGPSPASNVAAEASVSEASNPFIDGEISEDLSKYQVSSPEEASALADPHLKNSTCSDSIIPSEEPASENPACMDDQNRLRSHKDAMHRENPAADCAHLTNPAAADVNGNVILGTSNEVPLIDFIFPEYIDECQVKSIGDYAFKGCWVFKSVVIPLSVSAIGTEAFANCPNLERIILLGRADSSDMILGDHWSGNAEVIYGLIETAETETSSDEQDSDSEAVATTPVSCEAESIMNAECELEAVPTPSNDSLALNASEEQNVSLEETSATAPADEMVIETPVIPCDDNAVISDSIMPEDPADEALAIVSVLPDANMPSKSEIGEPA